MLRLQQVEDLEPSCEQIPAKWQFIPLQLEAKPSYASMTNSIHYIPNDPRLLPVDPRLKTGNIRGPPAPINPSANEESITPTPTVIVDSSVVEIIAQPKPPIFKGGKRRAKLQLNELANNFTSGGGSKEPETPSASSASPVTKDRSYLLDPRLKRRRIVTIPQNAAEAAISPVLESSGPPVKIAVQGPPV